MGRSGEEAGDRTRLRGITDDSVRLAKARFAKLSPEHVQAFLDVQPDIVRPRLVRLDHPSGGAGASNGIAFADVEVGDRIESLVIRYTAGVPLLRQKSVADEFALLQFLRSTPVPAPRARWLDATGALLGAPGFAMDRVAGEPPSAAMYSAGPIANVSLAERHALMLQAAAFHGLLRRLAIGVDQVPFLADRGTARRRADTAVERELDWWMDELALIGADDADPCVEEIGQLRDWLVRRQPHNLYTPLLVHGDSQIANIIFDGGKIAAVIDWELAYLGHVETDLAGVIFLTEAMKDLDAPADGTPTEAEYLAEFARAAGTPVVHWDYFRLMYMFKVVTVTRLAIAAEPRIGDMWPYYRKWMLAAWEQARTVYGD